MYDVKFFSEKEQTMKKTKRLLSLALGLIMILCLAVAMSTTLAAEGEPSLGINYCNLSFNDNIYIKYAVYPENITAPTQSVKLLIWSEPQDEYVLGTEDKILTSVGTQSISDKTHVIFNYEDLAAKQMTDVVYARAYTEVDGEIVYSGVNKYSILQYAYSKIGKIGTASTNAKLINMLNDMLKYGASTQLYFGYKLDSLATDDFYQIKVEGGTLDDGINHGLYKSGTAVTLTAPEADVKGHEFSRWVDSNGNEIATMVTYELTVGTANEIYTPIYEHIPVIDEAVAPSCKDTGLTEGSHCSVCGEVIVAQEIVEATGDHNFNEWVTVKEASITEEGLMERVCGCGEKETQTIEKLVQELEYTLNADRQSYSVTGIGTWIDSAVVIPDMYKDLPVTKIGDDAFHCCKNLTAVVIPNSVTYIGSRAFKECDSLTDVIIPDGVTIDYLAFGWCKNLSSVTIGKNVTFSGPYVFDYCTKLYSVVIGDGATSIGDHAFNECISLTSIVIPNSVTSIEASALALCSALTNITFEGTAAQWNAITKGYSWNGNTGSYTVYCTDGEIAKDGTFTCYHNSYTATVTPPPALENGLTTYTCPCGYSYTEAIIPTNFTVTSSNRALVGYTGQTGENLVIPAVFEDNGTWYRVVTFDNGPSCAPSLHPITFVAITMSLSASASRSTARTSMCSRWLRWTSASTRIIL